MILNELNLRPNKKLQFSSYRDKDLNYFLSLLERLSQTPLFPCTHLYFQIVFQVLVDNIFKRRENESPHLAE